MIAIVVVVGALIAFANGQNDVSKGIATLVGSGVTDHRRAIVWGASWTGAGGLAGAIVAGAMVTTFGNGLLASGTVPTLAAALAVLIGAAAWILVASRTGLPVSTTHALVGALVGVALVAYGPDSLAWGTLGKKLALPLLLGPVIALAATALLSHATRGSRVDAACACVTEPTVEIDVVGPGLARVAVSPPRLVVATSAACTTEPVAARITLDRLHWLTSGATSFARGLNDAPKIVALVLTGAVLSGGEIPTAAWFAIVTLAMLAGSLYGGLRVTRTLAERVTRMDHQQGFLANAVTAALVGLGAWQGLPLSTTHVSTGAIVGSGLTRSQAIEWRTVRGLVLAWVVTIPIAGVLAVASYLLLKGLGR